jgi:hypothetical protein
MAVDLESKFRAESRAITTRIDALTEPLTSIVLRPKKTNITPQLVVLAWAPYLVASDGKVTPAWEEPA